MHFLAPAVMADPGWALVPQLSTRTIFFSTELTAACSIACNKIWWAITERHVFPVHTKRTDVILAVIRVQKRIWRFETNWKFFHHFFSSTAPKRRKMIKSFFIFLFRLFCLNSFEMLVFRIICMYNYFEFFNFWWCSSILSTWTTAGFISKIKTEIIQKGHLEQCF